MAGKKAEKSAEKNEQVDRPQETMACPTFTLRADRPGHLRALLAAVIELDACSDVHECATAIREFELWEEAHR